MASYSERRWLAISEPGYVSTDNVIMTSGLGENDIVIGTWNLLAQSLTLRDRYPYSSECALDEKSRLRLTIKEISEFRPHILLLQEVEPIRCYEDTLKNLGYLPSYHIRPSSTYGCMILHKQDTFSLIDSVRFDFDNDRFAIEGRPRNINQTSTKSIGLFSILLHIPTQKVLIVGSGHMYWHPNADLLRLRQWLFYLLNLEDILKQWPEAAVLLAADFNTRPGDFVCSLVSGKTAPNPENCPPLHQGYSFEQIPEHEQKLYDSCINSVIRSKTQPSLPEILEQWKKLTVPYIHSVYSTYTCTEKCPGPPFTSYNLRITATDHIFVDKKKLLPRALLEIPSAEECSCQVALPNEKYPSDHISLGAIVTMV